MNYPAMFTKISQVIPGVSPAFRCGMLTPRNPREPCNRGVHVQNSVLSLCPLCLPSCSVSAWGTNTVIPLAGGSQIAARLDSSSSDECRQCVDAGFRRAGAADDRAGPGALLRRPGAPQEHPRHHDAELRHDGPGHHHLGRRRLLAGLWPRQHLHRRLRAHLPARRGANAQSRLRGHHPRADLHGLPAHVRHHHARR